MGDLDLGDLVIDEPDAGTDLGEPGTDAQAGEPDAGTETGEIGMAACYIVTFDAHGGAPVPELQMVEEGSYAQRPEDPTREGSVFTGWFLDGEDYFANPTPINGDVTLSAGWETEQPEQVVGDAPEVELEQQSGDEIEIVDQPEEEGQEGGETGAEDTEEAEGQETTEADEVSDGTEGEEIFEEMEAVTEESSYTVVEAEASITRDGVTTNYATLQAAYDASESGDTIKLLKDVTRSEVFMVYKSITLDGDGHKFITNDTRAIRIATDGVDVTIKNLIAETGTKTERCVQVDSSKKNVKLTIDNCTLTATMYTVNIVGDVENLNLTITDSDITGWSAVNLWGKTGTVNISGSTLTGINDKDYNADGWNNFGVVVVEGETTEQTTEHAEAYKITIEDSTIKAVSTTGNKQRALLYNKPSVSNGIDLINCSIVLDNGDCSFLANPAKNITRVKGTTDSKTRVKPVLPAGYAYSAPDAQGFNVVVKAKAAIAPAGQAQYFATFEEAVAEVKKESYTGDPTISLLADVEDDYTMSVGETLKIFDNNFAITVKAPAGYTLNQSTDGDNVTTYTLSANTYTVAYNANGGGGTMTNQGFTYDDKTQALTANAFTREGYTFTGWNEQSNGGSDILLKDKDKLANKNNGDMEMTLYAQWTVNAYTLTFDTDGGSAIDAITQDFGTEVKAPADPTKEGYTFKGWSPELPGTMPAKDMTVKAQWTVNQYTITFNTRGGSAIEAITLDYGAKVTAPKAPTRKGYTFNGWKPALPETMPAKDMTLRASWTINQYTITFNTNGGSAIAPITLNYGAKVAAPKAPTKKGYTFNGWKPELPAKMPAKNLTVKAGWTVNTYKVVFDRNGGSGTMKAQTFTYNAAQKLTANAFKRANYRFTGWNTKADGSGKAYANRAKVQKLTAKADGRVRLYAQWERNKPSGLMIPTVRASGTTAACITWTAMKNVDGYDVFTTRCGSNAYRLVATVTVKQRRSAMIRQLEAHKNYKFYVQAWVMNGSEKTYVSKSLVVHSLTGNTYGKSTNAKAVEVTKAAYSMSVGSEDTIQATVTGVKAGKKIIEHAGLLRYVTDDSKVATADRDGKITAIGKGSCNIYILASNGVYAKVRVTVK